MTGWRVTILWAAWLLCLSFPAAAVAASEPAADQANDGGYLFLDGKYVPPPYTIEVVDDQTLLLNTIRISQSTFDLSAYENDSDGFGPVGPWSDRLERGQQPFGRRSQQQPLRQDPLTRLKRQLELHLKFTPNGIAVLFSGRPPLFLFSFEHGHDLLRLLVERSDSDEVSADAPKEMRRESDRENWQQLVSEFRGSNAFLARAKVITEKLESAETANEAAARKNLISERIAFPMTVLAMLAVVLSFGHLMSNKPAIEVSSSEAAAGNQVTVVVIRSLALIALLSSVDLVWTLTASGSGSMRELNPFASGLMDNPIHLTVFKTALVGISIGIFFSFRNRRSAQIASWWSCLVLTLLTSRWLVFHSMFM